MVLGSPDRVNISCLMHDTRLFQYDVNMTCTELIRYKHKICYDVKTETQNIYVRSKDPTPEAKYQLGYE